MSKWFVSSPEYCPPMLLSRSWTVHSSKPECHRVPLINLINIHTPRDQHHFLKIDLPRPQTRCLRFKHYVGKKTQKSREPTPDLLPDIKRKKVWFYRCHMTLAWVTSIFPNGVGPGFLMESPCAVYQRSLSRKALHGPTSQTTSTFIATLREVFTSRK